MSLFGRKERRDFRHAGRAGFVDTIEGAPLPLVRVIGWYDGDAMPPMALEVPGRRIAPLSVARQARPDVLAAKASSGAFAGYRADFLLAPGETPVAVHVGPLRVTVPGADAYNRVAPHYGHLFTETRVLGRESIYGSGPPVDVSDEFKAFIGEHARGDVLDFGCGNGDLVAWLRARGLAAVGLELDEPRIHGALRADARAHVRLYDGSRPLPFDDGAFDAIVSTEVVEHVPGIAAYVAELARLLRPGGRLVLTTPDITSIPASFPANCVPWHLLESTHVNFFTPGSVAALFAPAFDLQSLACLGAGRVNGLFVPGSIGAVFSRRG